MAGWAAAAIAAAGQIAGGMISSKGQAGANEMNLQIARENRAWQQKMSSTAYQRSAHDLKMAGLNRILALGKPASTPPGNIATMQNEKAAVGQSVGNAANMAANTALQIAQARKLQAETNIIEPKATIYGAFGEYLNELKKRFPEAAEVVDKLEGGFKDFMSGTNVPQGDPTTGREVSKAEGQEAINQVRLAAVAKMMSILDYAKEKGTPITDKKEIREIWINVQKEALREHNERKRRERTQ